MIHALFRAVVVAGVASVALGVPPASSEGESALRANLKAAFEGDGSFVNQLSPRLDRIAFQDSGAETPRWSVGYKKGFFIKSPERNFRLRMDWFAQVRYRFDVRDQARSNSTFSDLELRRLKLKFSGNIFGPNIRYSAQLSRDRRTGDISLQSVSGRFRLTDHIQLKVGNFRPPLLREEAVSTRRQLLAERSTIARAFRQRRDLGVSLRYTGKLFRVRGGFFQSSDDVFTNDGWLMSARGEMLLLGKWRRLKDFTSFRRDKPVIAVGGGILYSHETATNVPAGDIDILRWTLDASAEFGGANAMIALIGNTVDRDAGPTLTQYGLVLQGGLFLTGWLEVFSRYEYGDADGAGADLRIITFGFNNYINKHRMKITTDFGFALDEVGSLWSSTATGFRKDKSGDTGQFLVRVQFQLLF